MEKIVLLKKEIIRTALIVGGALIVLLLLYIYLNIELEDTTRSAQQIENDTITLERQRDDNRNKNEVTARAVKIYYTLPEKQRSTPELEDAASRIRVARPIIDELRIRYKFSALNANFSKVEDVSEDFDVEKVKVIKSSITLEFRALTDELVFSFLDAMVKQMPGYVTIESLELNRESDITPAIIKSLLTRDPKIPFLVSGNATLNWWTTAERAAGDTPSKATTGGKKSSKKPKGGAKK